MFYVEQDGEFYSVMIRSRNEIVGAYALARMRSKVAAEEYCQRLKDKLKHMMVNNEVSDTSKTP